MSDKPILFSTPMVRALLAGTKRQTRRILKPETAICREAAWEAKKGADGVWRILADTPDVGGAITPFLRIDAGDRLYVREHWRTYSSLDGHAPRDITGLRVWYEADDGYKPKSRFRQGMHMPRWASRITLHVTDVRVHRLLDISNEDAIAEGIAHIVQRLGPTPGDVTLDLPGSPRWFDPLPRDVYSSLWEALHGAGSWRVNPWVMAATFEVELSNIDTARLAA